jgi:hypothetical protein
LQESKEQLTQGKNKEKIKVWDSFFHTPSSRVEQIALNFHSGTPFNQRLMRGDLIEPSTPKRDYDRIDANNLHHLLCERKFLLFNIRKIFMVKKQQGFLIGSI